MVRVRNSFKARAWIVSAARHKAIDRLRRDTAFRAKFPDLQRAVERAGEAENPLVLETEETFPDDRLRLIFTCCHPALATERRSLSLFVRSAASPPKRLHAPFWCQSKPWRSAWFVSKRKITEAAIPYSVPPAEMLSARLDAVLVTVYLIFTAGYTASSGEALIRTDLCGEAIRLGRLLVNLVPGQTEPAAVLALILFHDSAARQERTPQAISFCWKIRIAASGTARRSRKASKCFAGRVPAVEAVRVTASKHRLPQLMQQHRGRRIPIGLASRHSMRN